MKKTVLVCLLCILLLPCFSMKAEAYSSAAEIDWSRDLGGWTVGQTIQATDGTFITVGNSQYDGSVAYAVKTDPSNPLNEWSKSYPLPGASAVVQTDDDNFVVATGGSSNLFKIDSEGNLIWPTPKSYDLGPFTSIAQTSDGSLIVTGPISGSGEWDFCVLKTDSFGNELWHKSLDTGGYDWPSHIIETSDHQIVVVGMGNDDIWMIKLDASSGNKIWDKFFGGNSNDNAGWVEQTNDNGYIICGSTSSFSSSTIGYLVKTDASGAEIWDEYYDDTPDAGFASLAKTPSGGYMLLGSTGMSWNYKTWLVETDSTGIELRRLHLPESSGGSIQRTNDDNYILGTQIQIGGTQTSGIRIVKLAIITPEIALTRLASDIVKMDLQKGITISLDNKLYNVVDSLNALNVDNRNDAINKMNAFINEVNAQIGIKLSVDQANSLIAQAQKIITLISG
jgi:hypothetical protein